MYKPVIAIDGPAASGKGTLSRNIATALGYAHMDTGALYRAVAFELIKGAGLSIKDRKDAVDAAQILAKMIRNAETPDKILNNPALRGDDIGKAASKIAAFQDVRDVLLAIQRGFADEPGRTYKGAVLDGRDIGSVICPEADVKLFVMARDEIRAKRRTKELHSRGIEATYEAVLRDMRARDARDAGRQASPMTQAADAIVLDTSDLSEAQVFEKALEIINQALSD